MKSPLYNCCSQSLFFSTVLSLHFLSSFFFLFIELRRVEFSAFPFGFCYSHLVLVIVLFIPFEIAMYNLFWNESNWIRLILSDKWIKKIFSLKHTFPLSLSLNLTLRIFLYNTFEIIFTSCHFIYTYVNFKQIKFVIIDTRIYRVYYYVLSSHSPLLELFKKQFLKNTLFFSIDFEKYRWNDN